MAKMKWGKRELVSGLQGALWTGIGYALSDVGGSLLSTRIQAIGDFTAKGEMPGGINWRRALVVSGTGLLASGAVGGLMARKNKDAARKALPFLATGAVLAGVGPELYSSFVDWWDKTWPEAAVAGGNRPGALRRSRARRLPSTRRLAPTAAAPATAMARAGGILMGSAPIDADAAIYEAAARRTPGGLYINPQASWAGIREIP